MRPYHSEGPSDKNPGGEDLTARERVAYLREPRRPVFQSDLAGEDVTGDPELGEGRVASMGCVTSGVLAETKGRTLAGEGWLSEPERVTNPAGRERDDEEC